MPPANRRGRGGLAATARAAAASKLASASLDADATPIPPIRTSPRRQLSLSSRSHASHPPTNLSHTSTLTAGSQRASTLTDDSQKKVDASTASASRISLSKEFDSFSDQGVNSDDGSIAREKAVESDGSSDDEESGEKEEEEEKGSNDNQQNNQEIEDAVEFLGGNDDDSLGGVGDGCNDYAANDYDLFDRVWHWMAPSTIINEKNRRAIEACILIEAGQAVDECATTDEARLLENMRVNYTRLLREIPRERFESEAVYDAMLLQLKGGKEPSFSGKTLWRQQKEARKNVRTLASEMPGAANFHSLPSGQSLRDAFKKLICKKFIGRKGAKKQYDDVTEAWDDIPPGWWLEHHSIVFALALMVHRQSPTITAAAASVEPGPTRDQQHAAAIASVASERRVESVKRHQNKQSAVDLTLESTYKAARVEGMKGVAIKHRITAAEMKLRMMNENREYYVAAAEDTATGEAELNKKIKSVIDNLPDSFEDLTGMTEDDKNN